MSLAAGELDGVVDLDAVVPHGDLGDLLLGRRIGRVALELDVVGLPRQRREAHVDAGRFLAIEAAALVGLAFEAEAVEHLDLVLAVKVDAAVAAALAAGAGLERRAKLD